VSNAQFPTPTWLSEPPWAFKQHLSQPQRPVLPQGQEAPAEHVAITANWQLAAEGDDAPFATAVAELRRFCTEAGINLGNAGATHGDPHILLCAAGQPGDESYRLYVQPNRVVVSAANGRGVLQGVYALERMMCAAGGPFLPVGEVARTPFLKTRILRSFWSPYYIDELTTTEDYYPEGYLETLSRLGINGVWIHGYLQELVPSAIFPEFGRDSVGRLRKLNSLVQRAAAYGIDVYIYFCEPKALAADDPFWLLHPEVKGRSAHGNPMDVAEQVASLCTSAPQTKAYLDEAYYTLFRSVPGLGGVILITASENHSHCYSHGRNIDCPRCRERTPAEVVAELIQTVEQAVHRADPQAQVVAWTWSWYALEPDPQTQLLARLRNISLMSDFERGGEFTLAGHTYPIDEYSMKYIGPSPRFQTQGRAAKANKLPLFAKMQILSTHELATVPYFPVLWRMAEKWQGLRAEGVEGVMICWIFGNYPNFTLEVLRELTWEPHPPLEKILSAVARSLFGAEGAHAALQAWRCFGEAFAPYPFSTTLLYFGPMNRAPALPWTFPAQGLPMSMSWRITSPGDSIENWTIPFGPALVQKCFEQVLSRWEEGLQWLSRALPKNGDSRQPREPSPAEREMIVARAFAHHIRSTVNFLRYGQARDQYEQAVAQSANAIAQQNLLTAMLQAVVDEIDNRTSYLPLVLADSRLGYHSEAEDYFFTAVTLSQSIEQLRQLQDKLAALGAARS
jgi:hypothetical protein